MFQKLFQILLIFYLFCEDFLRLFSQINSIQLNPPTPRHALHGDDITVDDVIDRQFYSWRSVSLKQERISKLL